MRIAARFPGTCPTCSLPIAMGDHVEWTKGAKATHTVCPVASATVASASKPALPPLPTAAQLRKYGAPRTGRRYECEECGERVTPGTSCWETGAAH